MSKKVPVVKITTSSKAVDALAGTQFTGIVGFDDIAAALREGLLAMTTAAGLVVMRQIFETELASIVGPKHAKLGPDRVGYHHGTTTGQVVLGGRKVSVERPRGRSVGGAEVELETWSAFQATDPLTQIVVERMLAGVATRRHQDVADNIGIDGVGTSKSAVSRHFVAATTELVDEMLHRDLSDLDVAVLMVDGLAVAGQMIVIALVITTDGTKVPVGLKLGDTENTMVVKDLIADLVDRGMRYEDGILAVLDGAKALRRAVVKVFGDAVKIQRCTLHKRRNVIGYMPVARRKALDKRLGKAFAAAVAAEGIAECRRIAGQLKGDHPDAAASLLEGLDEMFTVATMGITGALRRSLTNTNMIESMIGTIRTVTARVKNWQDGEMKKRWIVTGMAEAQRSFRRVRGHRDMQNLVTAIRHRPNTDAPTAYDQAA